MRKLRLKVFLWELSETVPPFISMYLLGKSSHVVTLGSRIISPQRKGKDPEVYGADNSCKVGLGC